MKIFQFDEPKLVAKLQDMPSIRRTLFAAMVATRLAPSYRIYAATAGDSALETFNSSLEYLWACARGERDFVRFAGETSERIAETLALIPDEDDLNFFSAQADDAAGALAYALRSLNDPNPQEAAWAARRAYESADNLVISRAEVEIGGTAEEYILRDPLIQTELARQDEDLRVAATVVMESSALEQVRSGCAEWGKTFFEKFSHG